MSAITGSPTSHVIDRGDAQIYVEQHGSGPDAVLIGGLTDPLESWQRQIDGLADRYRLTVFDNRGVGRTKAPVSSISVPTYAADTAAIIEELGLERPHVMGFSGGGIIAQELAITRPELVGSLVLCSTFCRSDELGRRRLAVWLHLAATQPPEEFMRSFFTFIWNRAAHADGRVDQRIEEFLAYPYPMSDDAFVAQVEAFMNHETKSRLDRITAPTLVIAGEEDPNVSASMIREVVEGIAGAELVVMRDQSHQPFDDVPEEYNALVSGFWERVAA